MEISEKQIIEQFQFAMQNNELTFYLQPKCKIPTVEIVEAEALVRWKKADGTLISPGEFIPALENNGLISELDTYIWERVCAWLKSLQEKQIEPVRVSVNVSYNDVLKLDVADVLKNLCEKYEIPTDLIAVEITETVIAKYYDEINALLSKLKSFGFLTLMDDFGSGYSSLNMLNNVSVDVLKLDFEFLKNGSLSSPKNVKIIESIVNMAENISMPIVIEGVETSEQEKFLVAMGCRYAQGYYYYKPMPIEDFEELLKTKPIDKNGFDCKHFEQIHVKEFLDENNFNDTMLNNILGAVAFFEQSDKDLSISRYNSPFASIFNDINLESRKVSVQDFVVEQDLPEVYETLENARNNLAVGDICELRIQKAENELFWYKLHFFYLKEDDGKHIYYGKIEDITEARERNLRFLEVLRYDSESALVIDVDSELIQYFSDKDALKQSGMPAMNLETSIKRTVESRIEKEEDKKKFIEFFNTKRMRDVYNSGVFFETLSIDFKMNNESCPVEFITYYTKWNKYNHLRVYSFVKRK